MYFKDILGNTKLKKVLIQEVKNKRVAHAQLFDDHAGCGLAMGLAFSMYLLCKNKLNNDACGICSNCHKVLKLTYPDLHFFYPTIGHTKESGSKATFSGFQKLILENPYISIFSKS